MSVVFGQWRLVAHDHVEPLAVRGGEDGVRTMFTGCLSECFDGDQLVELVVVIGIKQPKDSSARGTVARVHHNVETVEGVAESLSMTDLGQFGEFIVELLGGSAFVIAAFGSPCR